MGTWPRKLQGTGVRPRKYYDALAVTMTLWYLVCVKCRRISALVEDYRPGEENRGEWEPFRGEHRGHHLFIGQSVGQ